jgi:hypothetical protein
MFLTFVLTNLAIAVNHRPVITVNAEAEPIIRKYGEEIELPFEVTDVDGDAVTLFYKFNGETEWSRAPAGTPLNVLPGSCFAHLSPDGDHTIHLLASDGTLDSQPVQLGFGSWFKKLGSSVKRIAQKVVKVVKKVAPVALNIAKQFIAPPQPEEPPGEEQPQEPPGGEQSHGIGIPMRIQSLRGPSVAVSYSFDDSGVWSKPENYPLGEFAVLVPAADFASHATPGQHKILFRYEEPGDMVSQDTWTYEVNSRPAIQVSNAQPLSFKGAPSGPVSLPLSVHDVDGDDVSLWYRFDGQGDWTYVPAGLGSNVLPAEAFASRSGGSNGYLEVAAWDGYEHSDERVRIGYAIEGEAQNQEDDTFFGALSPAAFAGIIVGAVAVIALAVAIIVVARRKKPESSSTGLIDSE